MTTAKLPFEVQYTESPTDFESLCAAVQHAAAQDLAIYPVGGGTSLDFGLPPTRRGVAIHLLGLKQVIDYPARDMTITIESGMTIAHLAQVLAEQGQWLPIDVPQAEQATIGGVIATNFSGARRYGQGTMRDYLIGIQAVDAEGQSFQAGGRVVKNVAGYDFCKLLTGSLGTLGVISQVTLKVKPIPQASRFALCPCHSHDDAERVLSHMVQTRITPVAMELLSGPAWQSHHALAEIYREGCAGVLAIGMEGTGAEVRWMCEQLHAEFREMGLPKLSFLEPEATLGFWQDLADFPAEGVNGHGNAALVLKATMLPSGLAAFCQRASVLDNDVSLQAHAGDGVVILRYTGFPQGGVTQTLLADLMPRATAGQGNIVMLSNQGQVEMTHQAVWGGIGAPFDWMTRIKNELDPTHRLNPGRFVYHENL